MATVLCSFPGTQGQSDSFAGASLVPGSEFHPISRRKMTCGLTTCRNSGSRYGLTARAGSACRRYAMAIAGCSIGDVPRKNGVTVLICSNHSWTGTLVISTLAMNCSTMSSLSSPFMSRTVVSDDRIDAPSLPSA